MNPVVAFRFVPSVHGGQL